MPFRRVPSRLLPGRPAKPAGLAAFCRAYPRARPLMIGGGGVSLEEFFATAPQQWLEVR